MAMLDELIAKVEQEDQEQIEAFRLAKQAEQKERVKNLAQTEIQSMNDRAAHLRQQADTMPEQLRQQAQQLEDEARMLQEFVQAATVPQHSENAG